MSPTLKAPLRHRKSKTKHLKLSHLSLKLISKKSYKRGIALQIFSRCYKKSTLFTQKEKYQDSFFRLILMNTNQQTVCTTHSFTILTPKKSFSEGLLRLSQMNGLGKLQIYTNKWFQPCSMSLNQTWTTTLVVGTLPIVSRSKHRDIASWYYSEIAFLLFFYARSSLLQWEKLLGVMLNSFRELLSLSSALRQ